MAVFTMNEVKVGIMVVLAAALLFVLTVAVGNYKDFLSDKIVISILVSNVVGLDDYAPVSYAGVRIGTVMEKTYDENRELVVIKARIERNSPVAMDSEVRFTSESLLAPLFIDIYGGSKEKRIARLLDENDIDPDDIFLNAEPYASVGDFFALAGDMKNLLAQVQTVLGDIHDPILRAGGMIENASQELDLILDEVQGTVSDVRPHLTELMKQSSGMVADASQNLIPALENINRGAQSVPGLVADTRQDLHEVMSQASGLIRSLSPEITQTAQEVRRILQDLRGRMQRLEDSLVRLLDDTDSIVADNREEITRIIGHLERTMANLDDMSQQLARDPWRLIWKTEERRVPPKVSPDWDPFATPTPSPKK